MSSYRLAQRHEPGCGGPLLRGADSRGSVVWCRDCDAYQYDHDESGLPFPSGQYRSSNQAHHANGVATRSPDAHPSDIPVRKTSNRGQDR